MAQIFTDDFNSYTDGDLNTQGGWSGGTMFDIQGTIVQEGTKAVKAVLIAGGGQIAKVGSAVGTGDMSIYMRVASMPDDEKFYVQIKEGATMLMEVRFSDITGSKKIEYFAGGSWTNIQSWVVNTWYKINIQWQTSDNTFRVKVGSGSWTGWTGTESAFTNADTIQLLTQNNIEAYFDNIGAGDTTTSYTYSSSDILSLTDIFSVRVFFKKILTDSILLVETIRFSAMKFFVSIIDNISLQETLNKITKFKIQITETLQLNEIFSVSTKIWTFLTKNISTWTHQSKSTTPTWTHQSKSSSPTWTWKNKP